MVRSRLYNQRRLQPLSVLIAGSVATMKTKKACLFHVDILDGLTENQVALYTVVGSDASWASYVISPSNALYFQSTRLTTWAVHSIEMMGGR